ncbi:ExbD/TolR family protein [Ruegeria sp.]|uniref:ExbD/TolR family protein n=1 Tax=Ruegeria sp. TaxID=1879320 RepID=UPI003C79BE71
MALETRKKRRRRLSMTSLIDVIFLLLLFFMLTSTFSKFGEVEFATATEGGSETDVPLRFVKLEQDRILVDGTEVTLDAITTLFDGNTAQLALISLDQNATSQQLIDLLTTLRPVASLRVQVIG